MSDTDPVADNSNSDSEWSQALFHALDNDKHPLFVEENRPRGLSTPYIDLSTLQRLNLYNLQRNLVTCVKDIIEAKTRTSQIPLDLMNKLPELLTPYFAALRDAKWVRQCLVDPAFRDPMGENLALLFDTPGIASMFVSTGLLPRQGQQVPPSKPALPRVPNGWDISGILLEEHRQKQEKRRRETKAFVLRLYMAAFGGLALIGPMLIMTLHSSKVTSLVTTSIFVTVVAALLAYFFQDATPKDIMGATAAYAAVLVVFVGAST